MFISLHDLNERAGQKTGEFAMDLANDIANYACSLYRDYPGAFVGPKVLPGGAFVKGLWDTLCKDRPGGLPPVPAPPFKGGQCVNVSYMFNTSSPWVVQQTGGPPVNAKAIYGPVTARSAPYRGRFNDWNCDVTCRDINGNIVTQGYLIGLRSEVAPTLTNFYRVDGQADTCGDIPPVYPVTPIPPAAYNREVPYAYNDGVTLGIPVIIAPINVDGRLVFNAGGLTFKLDTGGVDVTRSDGSDVTLEQILGNLLELQGMLDAALNPLDPEDDPTLDYDTLPDDTGGEEEGLDGLKWVVVVLTNMPDKAQFGNPTCFFAGWITFKIGDDWTPREQVNFARSVFRAPGGASGYGVTFTNRARGTVTAYTTTEE